MCDVSLRIVPVAGVPKDPAAESFLRRHCADFETLPVETAATDDLPRLAAQAVGGSTIAALLQSIAGRRFDAVHVARLYMAPLAHGALTRAGQWSGVRKLLDLDDDEGETLRRIGAQHMTHGRAALGLVAAREAKQFDRLEATMAPQFDRLLVCSKNDAATLQARHRNTKVTMVPNALRPPRQAKYRSADRLLFVGTLGYSPNTDAGIFLATEILPRVTAAVGRPVELLLVGADPPNELAALAVSHRVTVAGQPKNLGALYAAGGIAVLPIFAGGGTRIKAIEAFAHHCPLVSTSVGVEGLDIVDGTHAILAENADDLAASCVRILQSPALGATLTDAGSELYHRCYAFNVVAETIKEQLLADEH